MWPPKNADEMRALQEKYGSDTAISVQVGRAGKVVSKKRRELGVPIYRFAGFWTEERVEMLRELWLKGLSGSQIAERIGGCTRNAVIGKAHRVGLPGRPKPHAFSNDPFVSERREERQRRQEAAKILNLGAEFHGDADHYRSAGHQRPLPVTSSIYSSCQWPLGDPGDPGFHFCGGNPVSGRPYCPKHCEAAYLKRDPAKARVAG